MEGSVEFDEFVALKGRRVVLYIREGCCDKLEGVTYAHFVVL